MGCKWKSMSSLIRTIRCSPNILRRSWFQNFSQVHILPHGVLLEIHYSTHCGDTCTLVFFKPVIFQEYTSRFHSLRLKANPHCVLRLIFIRHRTHVIIVRKQPKMLYIIVRFFCALNCHKILQFLVSRATTTTNQALKLTNECLFKKHCAGLLKFGHQQCIHVLNDQTTF